ADVKLMTYQGKNFAPIVHLSVIATSRALKERGIEDPTVAVLCRSNALLAELSALLREEHTVKGARLGPIVHDVAWDAELSAAAGAAVASIMEWNSSDNASLGRTLKLIAHYYRLKNAEHPSKAAAESAEKFEEAVTATANGKLAK